MWNIYGRHLRRWFHRMLNQNEAAEMESVFQGLRHADSQMETAISDLTRWLSEVAGETLDLVDAGKLDDANQKIRAARKEVQPVRDAIGKTMKSLLELQGDFIAISGTV